MTSQMVHIQVQMLFTQKKILPAETLNSIFSISQMLIVSSFWIPGLMLSLLGDVQAYQVECHIRQSH